MAVQLTIDSIATGGDGVGRANGMVVFVPRTAPGDLISANIVAKGRLGRGTIASIDRMSGERVDPVCNHYVADKCGGCQLQHINYAGQLTAKSTIIRDGLTRLGKRAVDTPSVEQSPTQWRYRTKLTLAMRRSGTKWVMGLHPYDDPVGVFQLKDCPITDERVIAVWREILDAADLLPEGATRGSVRMADTGSVVVIEGGSSWPASRRFFDAVPRIGTLWWKPENRPREAVASRQGKSGAPVFAQINPGMAEALHSYVVDRVRTHSPRSVIDAYAGTGATAIQLANAGVRVTAIELDEAAAKLTASSLSKPSRSIAARVEDVLPASLPADVVLVNPPRTGLADAVPAQLERARASMKALIYVSCNPATLGRDVARLPHFTIRSVRGFDMFPQTAHVETVCELVPEAA
ncbi:MAG TPA: hypothetical protein VIV65_08180 [Gemmatimonadaceae bacterium]